MKKLFFLLFSIGLIAASCNPDPVDPASELELSLDGENQAAPFFDPGNHESAARFNANVMRQYEGKKLEAVEFYLVDRPAECEVRIYGQGTSSEPGALLYSGDVSNTVSGNVWNRHEIGNPIDLDGGDIWIAIWVKTVSRLTIMGCDPGPANANGDWIFSDGNNDWETFRDRTNNEVNINWNIRGDVTD